MKKHFYSLGLVIKLLVLIITVFGFVSKIHATAYTSKDITPNFTDISGSGTSLLKGCDDCGIAVDIGFEFTYYGRVYTQLYVSSNGFVVPGGSAPLQGNRITCCHGFDIPSEDNIEGVIALWWVDLSLAEEDLSTAKEEKGEVLYELQGSSENHVFIVQFNKVRHFHNLATNDASTFQLKIFQSDNHLEMHYDSLIANQNIHTIGLENPRQDSESVKYFRTKKGQSLPDGGSEFAISFSPPELGLPAKPKLTSSLRYGALGNFIKHEFEVGGNVASVADLKLPTTFTDTGTLTIDVDYDGATLLNNNPARFSLAYELIDVLGGAVNAGDILGDLINFKFDDDSVSLESQTIYISQGKEFPDEESQVTDYIFSSQNTITAFKSKEDLSTESGVSTKNPNADDVFFLGFDPDSQVLEIHQLTALSSDDKCGIPFIEQTDDIAYLYVMCTTDGASNNEVIVTRYDLETYLDDNETESSLEIEESQHDFDTGTIETEALVVAGGGVVAYTKDIGGGNQDIYIEDNALNINIGVGPVKSLAIDESGENLVYVIGDTAYFYDGSGTPLETPLTPAGVESANISADGSTIVFSSNDDAIGNNNGTLEIFTVPTGALTTFEPRTNLTTGDCKLPVISNNAKRIAVVCDEDLLALGSIFVDRSEVAENSFTDREAVFIIEDLMGDGVYTTHLITGTRTGDIKEAISRLSMSGDGSAVSFQAEDASEENTFRLTGLSNLDPNLEELAAKEYPIPFFLPGDGKSGSILYIYCLLGVFVLLRFIFMRSNIRARS